VLVQVHALGGKSIQDQHNGEQTANRHTKNMRDTSVMLGHFRSPPFIPAQPRLMGALCRTTAPADVMAITKWSVAIKPAAGTSLAIQAPLAATSSLTQCIVNRALPQTHQLSVQSIIHRCK